MVYHMFDVDVAKEVGIIAAILFQHIAFWCQHSYANGTNYYEGRYWTYNSIKAFRDIFPYLSKSQVDTALKKLVDAGLIVKGNFNKSTYDRTAWYALTEIGNALFKNRKSISEKSEMESQEIGNGFPGNRKPIPDINTDITHDVNTDRVKHERFTPPTIEQVSAYASEMGWTESQFMPERFVDFYESKGWKVGKDTMKSWKAAARGWVSRQKQPATIQNKPNPALDYSQRKYTDADFGDDFFVDLSKYGGDNNA